MQILKKIIKLNNILSKKNKRKIPILIFIMLLGATLEIFSLGALLPFFTILLDSGSINTENEILTKIFSITNQYIGGDRAIFIFLLVLLFIFSIKFIFLVFLTHYIIKFSYRVYKDTSRKLLKGYLSQNFIKYIGRNSSDLIHNIQIEVNFLTGHFLLPFLILSTEIIVIIFISLFLMYFFFEAFLVIISFYSVVIILYLSFTRKKNLEWGANRQKFEKIRIKYLHECILNLRDIKVFKAIDFFIKKHQHYLNLTNKYQILQQTFQYVPSRVIELISMIGFVILVFFLKLNNYSNSEILIITGIFVTGSFKILPSLNRVISSMQNIRFSGKSVDLIEKELLDFKKTEVGNSYKLKELSEDLILKLDSVNFKYNNSNNLILKNLNFELKKNEFVGISGKSGSGKSTLLNILIGLIKPKDGNLILNNKILKNPNTFAFVPQEVSLTDGSIEENIAFGLNVDEVNIEKVKKVADYSQLSEMIQNLNDGLKSNIGDRGSNLSGGQRQRIGIARALYSGFDILVLDEPTSSLDRETENDFIEYLNTIKNKYTIVLCSHNENLLKNCNIRYKLENYELKKVR